MKTPSYLPLLLLFAALPATAEIKPGERCDTVFLDLVVNAFKVGGTVTEERIVTKAVNGVTFAALKFDEAKTCDAGTWRHLAAGAPLVWRNADAGKHWAAGNAGANAALVLVADDFFKAFDPKAAEVLAAADAVIEAGVQLGVITAADGAKPLSELLKGASGGRFGALKPKTVTAVEAKDQKANLPPEQLGAVLRKLLDEIGAAKAGGSAVLDFRVAVMALNAELGRLGASNDAVAKRTGAALPAVKDFMPGLPAGYIPAKAAKAEAMKDVEFGVALAALIGAGTTPALDDVAPRAGSLLEPVDLGLRNLVAIRAAQVEQIVAAAKLRLNGKKITDLEVAARAAGVVAKLPANSLAAAVLQRLSQTPEYARLDTLYENNLREQGPEWAKKPEAQAMFTAREELKAAALSAKIETNATTGKKEVVFTQGGKRTVLDSLVPLDVENDPAARANAATHISRLIINGALGDAKYQAVVAAIAGEGQPGKPVNADLKPEEVPVARDVPPATKKIKDGAAGCNNPKDAVRNDYETYAARQSAAAAEMAGGNLRSREDVEKKRLEAQAASVIACQKKKDAALAIKQDYFDDPAIAKAAREKSTADAATWCAADVKAIDAAAADKIKALAALEAGDRDPAKLRARADADLAAGFGVAIAASIEILRKDYTKAGSARLRKLAEATGNSPRLTAFTELWFAKEWPLDASKKKELEAAVGACAKALGLGDAVGSPSYRNPENSDNIDKHCKVNEKLTKYIADSKGSVRQTP